MLADALLRLILAWPSSPFSVRPAPAGDSSNSWLATLPFGPFAGGGLVQEVFPQGMGKLEPRGQAGAALRGSNRAYLVADATQHTWSSIEYTKLNLLGKTVSFTVDVSGANCGCNAALYLVAMDRPTDQSSGYCDIQAVGGEQCLEIDLLEANRKAVQATLHTQGGIGTGPCNQWGCAVNFGKTGGGPYGQGSPAIDSNRPFNVSASFTTEGVMDVLLSQGGRHFPFWNVSSAS